MQMRKRLLCAKRGKVGEVRKDSPEFSVEK